MTNFCVYVATHKGDFHYAKILCASVRYFCGDVPIFLLKDGDFNTDQIKVLGNIHEYDYARSPVELASFIHSWNKFRVFFDSEFDRFLFLDADIVLVRDILTLPWPEYDFLADMEIKDLTDPAVRESVQRITFDFDRIHLFDPEFIVDNTFLKFCSGHFFARTGIFDLDDIVRIVDHKRNAPEDELVFYPMWDEGMLNYLVNKGVQQNKLTASSAKISLPLWEPRESFPGMTVTNVMSKTYNGRYYLLHFYTPRKRDIFRNHVYGDLLLAFNDWYYSHLSLTMRLRTDVSRLMVIARKRMRKLIGKVKNIVWINLPPSIRPKLKSKGPFKPWR